MRRAHALIALGLAALVALVACGGPHPGAASSSDGERPRAGANPDHAPASEPRPMIPGPDASDGVAVASWISDLVALQAQRGQKLRVRVPLVVRSDGWGCRCPRHFLGVDPNSHDGGDTWVTVDASAVPAAQRAQVSPPSGGAGAADAPYPGAVLVVEGYLPGTRSTIDLRRGDGSPEEWRYRTWDLQIDRIITSDAIGAAELRVHAEQAAPGPAQRH